MQGTEEKEIRRINHFLYDSKESRRRRGIKSTCIFPKEVFRLLGIKGIVSWNILPVTRRPFVSKVYRPGTQIKERSRDSTVLLRVLFHVRKRSGDPKTSLKESDHREPFWPGISTMVKFNGETPLLWSNDKRFQIIFIVIKWVKLIQTVHLINLTLTITYTETSPCRTIIITCKFFRSIKYE